MAGIFGDPFDSRGNVFATALMPPARTPWPAPASANPLAIPPAQPPIFLSPPGTAPA